MLTADERKMLLEKAYIPEHLPHYGSAISGMDASVHRGYLYYRSKDQLNLVGYPLDMDFDPVRTGKIFEDLLDKHRPAKAAVIAPELPEMDIDEEAVMARSRDKYLLLETEKVKPGRKLRSLLRRAGRELTVETGSYGREHEALIGEFLRYRNIPEEHSYIFKRLPNYLQASKTALLLEARSGEDLVAFQVVDFSGEYGFYMFSFLSRKRYIPGASDLLLRELIRLTKEKGLGKINMGLVVNKGIGRFKEKWGAETWLRHEYLSFSQELVRILKLSRSMGI